MLRNLLINFKRLNLISALTCLILLLTYSQQSFAYSYAAAGKEPVIEGRELLLKALSNNDYVSAQAAFDSMKNEFIYFNTDHGLNVDEQMQTAINEKNKDKILAVMNLTMKAEVMRRLEGAEENINDYQIAKVLVVKSKLFIDLMASDLTPDNRKRADLAIRGALSAIGNPGVFGVGQKPADKAKFIHYRKQLAEALSH